VVELDMLALVCTTPLMEDKMYFFAKTQNPRPSFHLDMTDDERAVMQRHVTYWSEKATQGIAIVFGPVMDPDGVYGIAICRVADEAEMRALLQADPAKGLLQYNLLPMADVVVGMTSKP
jgi:hypothetical protein